MSRRHLLSLRFCGDDVVDGESVPAAVSIEQCNNTTHASTTVAQVGGQPSHLRAEETAETFLGVRSIQTVSATTSSSSTGAKTMSTHKVTSLHVSHDPSVANTSDRHGLGEPATSFLSVQTIQSSVTEVKTPTSRCGQPLAASHAHDVISFSDSDDEVPTTQRLPNDPPPAAQYPMPPEPAEVRCPSCGKLLTFLNERGQLQHVNACLDQLEQFAQNKKAAAPPAPSTSTPAAASSSSPPSSSPIMPCTVCGVDLVTKSSPQRVNHIKQCGRRFGVTVQSLRIDQEAIAAPPDAEVAAPVAAPNAFEMLMKNAQTSAMLVTSSIAKMASAWATAPSSSAVAGKKRKAATSSSWSSYKAKGDVPCPQYKIIKGSTIVVDGFQYAKPSLSKVYFLSHYHSDHYIGLTKSFSAGMIYCTAVTAKLVLLCLGVNKKYVHPLPMNQPYVLPDQQGQVTLLEANHCPGAALLLFQLRGGKTYLHTGDFRYDPSMLDSRFLFRFAHQEPPLDGVYLDTTYCEPRYCHPTQAVAIGEAKRLVDVHDGDRALFLFGSYSIGKERLFMEVARHLQRKVYVERTKYSLMSCFDWPEEDMAMLTLESSVTNLHVVPMGSLNFDVMGELLTKHRLRFQKVIAFQPTGWTFSGKHKLSSMRTQRDGNLIIYGIPYSEHSSFEELCAFVTAFKPTKIIPTVNCGKSQKQVDLLRQTCFHNITHHFKAPSNSTSNEDL